MLDKVNKDIILLERMVELYLSVHDSLVKLEGSETYSPSLEDEVVELYEKTAFNFEQLLENRGINVAELLDKYWENQEGEAKSYSTSN